MRIYVGGSLRHVARNENFCPDFVSALGREIVRRDHILLSGCKSTFDKAIAEAAEKYLKNNGYDPNKQIISYCLKKDQPIHNAGLRHISALPDWNINHARLAVPEQIQRADVAIFVAGNKGTYWARNWAFYARKPILATPYFGGAGGEIFFQDLELLRVNSPRFAEQYEKLNLIKINPAAYAQTVVKLAEERVVPRMVFPILSYKKKHRDTYNAFRAVCKDGGFELTERTDEAPSGERIIPRIETGIQQSAFVIADISENSPNVFYEIGYARGLGKDIILTAKQGTEIPFDLHDIPAILWKDKEDMKELKEGLEKRVLGLRLKFGITNTHQSKKTGERERPQSRHSKR